MAVILSSCYHNHYNQKHKVVIVCQIILNLWLYQGRSQYRSNKMQQSLKVAFKGKGIPLHKKFLSLVSDCFNCVVPAKQITDVCKKLTRINPTLALTIQSNSLAQGKTPRLFEGPILLASYWSVSQISYSDNLEDNQNQNNLVICYGIVVFLKI